MQALQSIGSNGLVFGVVGTRTSALLALDKLLQAVFTASLVVNDVVEYHGLLV